MKLCFKRLNADVEQERFTIFDTLLLYPKNKQINK